MKKVLISALVLGFLVAPTLTLAASNELDSINAADRAEIAFSKSNNVTILYGDDNNATNPQGYGVISKHAAGNRFFAASDRSNPVFIQDEACKGATLLATVAGCTLPAIGDIINGTNSLDTGNLTATASTNGQTWAAL